MNPYLRKEFSVILCCRGFLRILVHWVCCLLEVTKAEIIIVKCLIQGRNNVTRVWVEPRACDQGRRKNVFTLSTTLPTCWPLQRLLILAWIYFQFLLSHALLRRQTVRVFNKCMARSQKEIVQFEYFTWNSWEIGKRNTRLNEAKAWSKK